MRHEESREQQALIRWADATWMPGASDRKIGAHLYAVPNGGMRNKITAAILKSEGVRAGVPDIVLAWPAGGHHGLYIELKRPKGGRTSEAQREWILRLRAAGYAAHVCHGFEEARQTILEYLGVPAAIAKAA